MKEVTHDEFYSFVGNKDAVVSAIGDYPYTSVFRMRHTGKEIGRVVDSYENPKYRYPLKTQYYILSN